MSETNTLEGSVFTQTHTWQPAASVLTYWWILLVQFLLLREEVQALPQRHPPSRAPLGDWQRQITEYIECVGVVRANWAMQWAPQLAWEQVCQERSKKWAPVAICEPFLRMKHHCWIALLTYYYAVISLQVFLPHGCCLFRNSTEDQEWETECKMCSRVQQSLKNRFFLSYTHLNLTYFCSGSFPVLLVLGLLFISVCSLSSRNRRNSWASCWLN